MHTCPNCKKTLPIRDGFCVYCGTALPRALPWQGWLPARAQAGASRPAAAVGGPAGWLARNRFRTMAVVGGLLGAGVGGILGQAFGNGWLGALVGGVGVGVAAAVGEGAAGPLPDRRSAERFGAVLGGLGGLLGLGVGVLVAAGVMGLATGWDGVVAYAALLGDDLSQALLGPIVGALVGTVTGALAGYYLSVSGYRLGRRGAIAGAALAWTLAAVLAGLVTADQVAQSEAAAGVARGPAAALGIALQVGGGAALLAAGRRWLGRLRGWWLRP